MNSVSIFNAPLKRVILIYSVIAFYMFVFPVLKLCGVIHCSWLLATAPIWFPFFAFLFVAGFIAFVAATAELVFMNCPDDTDTFEKYASTKKKEEVNA